MSKFPENQGVPFPDPYLVCAVQRCLPFMCTGGVMRSPAPSFSKHRQSLDREFVARDRLI